MKTKMKIKTFLLGVCALAFVASTGATAYFVNAESEAPAPALTMQEGASIRTFAPTGIRFVSEISKADYDNLTAKDAKFYTLIMPEKLVPAGGITAENYMTVNAERVQAKNSIVVGTDTVTFSGTLVGKANGDGTYEDYFPDAAYNMALTAVSYYTYTENKVETVVFANNPQTYSIAYIASALLASGKTDPYYAKITDSVLSGGISFGSESYKLCVGKPLNTTLNAEGLKAVYTSDNEEVVTIDKEGKLTGVGVGTAKITATIGSKTATANVTVESIEPTHEAIFVIAFDANDGTGSTQASGVPTNKENVEWGSTIDLTSQIARDGYTFLGWATSADADTPDYGASALENVTAYFYINGDVNDPVETGETVTLYAVWQANEYALNIVQNGYADLGTHTSNTNGKASTPDYIAVSATKAVFDTDITFTDPSTLSKYSDFAFETVVTIGGNKYNLASAQDGKFTIPGADVTGAVSITVTRHIKGYEILEDKASVTYTDGDGVYGADGKLVASNGNSAKYEGVYEPSKGAYFRVTVVTKSIDNEGTATTSDQINVWMLKNGGTAAADAVRLRFGLSGSTINQNQSIDFTKVVYATPNSDGTYTSVFELHFPAAALTDYVSGDNLYLMIAYTPSDEKYAHETCVFAGKPQRADFARYWSLCGTEANTVGWRNGILVNANGFYDFNGQAKLNGVTLDGKLDESAWSDKTSVTYAAADMGKTGKEEITYTGFMGTDGFYYAATLKISSYTVTAADLTDALILNFKAGGLANPRIELQITGIGNVNRVMGGVGVYVAEKDANGYYTVTFEGYVPYRVLDAKWPSFTYTTESLSLYMGFNSKANQHWLKTGEFNSYNYNFTITKAGLALKG